VKVHPGMVTGRGHRLPEPTHPRPHLDETSVCGALVSYPYRPRCREETQIDADGDDDGGQMETANANEQEIACAMTGVATETSTAPESGRGMEILDERHLVGRFRELCLEIQVRYFETVTVRIRIPSGGFG
jgi:hypothetical protein